MSKNVDLNSIIHADSSGKLYIKSPDFFKLPKIQQMVNSMMESSIFKKIEKNKHKK